MQLPSIKLEVPGASPKPQIHPENNENNSRFKSDIDKANIFSFVYFTFVWGLIKSAYKAAHDNRMISAKDLISFPWNIRADTLSARFMNQIQKQKSKGKINLSWAILWTVKWPLLKIITLETCFVFSRIFSAWVVKKLIDSYVIAEKNHESWTWAGILTACLVVAFHFEHHFNHLAAYLPNHVQNALISLVYGKITRLSTDALTKISMGKLVNICTNGVNLFEQLGMFVCNIFVGLFALVAGGALLWQYFGVYCLVGLGYIVFWYPWQQIFIMISLKERDRTNVATANRIRMTSETIEAIRLLKMYTWELNFKEKIENLRKVEMNMLRSGAITSSIIRGLSFSTQVCSTFLMFLAYALSGHTLRVGEVFSAYFVIGYLRLYSSYFFGLALNFLTDARILIRGIQQVLETPEIGEIKFEAPRESQNAIEYENFNSYWNSEAQAPTLSNVNLRIKKGSLNALVGAVGSGKTSLLMSFTGEMPKT